MDSKARDIALTNDEEAYYAWADKAARTLARIYDGITAFDGPLRRRVVTFTEAPAGGRVLDVGTGTGKQAFAFGAKGYDVVGVDLSEDMLRVAARKNKYPNVRLQPARATDLPFEDETFDVACVSFALHDMPRYIREKAVQEMVRVTRPGGAVVVVDYGLPANRVGRFLVYRTVRLWEKFYPEFIASDLEALLRQTGVEVTHKAPVLLGTARILRGRKDTRAAGATASGVIR